MNKRVVCRDANTELLRCILMFLIVCLHTWGHGVWKEDRSFWTLFFTVFTYWHVPAFVSISGWYGIRFSLKKFLSLWGQFAFYSFLSVIYILLFDKARFSMKTCVVYGGWFGGAYMMLLCFSPFANMALERLVKLPWREVLITWGGFVFAFSCHLFPFRVFSGISDVTQQSFGFVSLLVVYVTMRIVRDKVGGWNRFFTHKVFVGVLIAYCTVGVVIAYVMGTLSCKTGSVFRWSTGGYFSFSSPLNWGMGIYIVVWFIKNVHISGRMASWFRYLGPSMFGIYLFHETTSFGQLLYKPLQYRLIEVMDSPITIIFITGISTFLIGLFVDISRRLLVSCLMFFCKKVGKEGD